MTDKQRQEVCTCGKSPSGFCEHWHDLEGHDYFQKLKEYREQHNTKKQ